ncbi:carbohydrate binding domain-containing protein [Microbacterium sp. ZW T6_19]|uniref:carbohydrate binding domain-containing protein n=1 Tax=Microbacterium sp. ZW T6_19 TaxID=3378082 RepID=UPI0038529B27
MWILLAAILETEVVRPEVELVAVDSMGVLRNSVAVLGALQVMITFKGEWMLMLNRPKHRRGLLGFLATAALAVAVLSNVGVANAAGSDHFVDCSASTSGLGTQASPWNSLAQVNAMQFGPGERVLFKAGTTCVGQLTPSGSGAAGNPAALASYGLGAKPIIDGAGVVGPVIKLLNVQQWELSGLEIRNAAATPAFRSGILAENSSGTTLSHIVITDMTIRNISGWSGGWYSSNAGIGIQTDSTTAVSTWNDITIADNSFDHVDRIAVAVTPEGNGRGTGPTTNVRILNNNIRYSGGDDILVVNGVGALIDGNDAAHGGVKATTGCPPSGNICNTAAASIWVAGSSDTMIQNNTVACTINKQDGSAFDVDWGNHNTTIQYNYSRNNSGGFLLMMQQIGSEPPSDGTVVRYNVSDGDTNTAGCPIASNFNRAHNVFDFPGAIPNQSGSAAPLPDIYNNTIYISSGRPTSVVGTRTGNTQPGSYQFRNNLVLNFGSKGYLQTTGSVFANNLLYGPRNNNEPTTGTMYLSPQLVGPLQSATQPSAGASTFQPRETSAALGAGVTIPSNGGRDFAGDPIAAVPSIGAYENADTSVIRNGSFDSGALTPWTLSGAGSSLTTSTRVNGTAAVQTGNSNSGVENVVSGLSPSTTYLLSAWVKVEVAGEQVAIGVKGFGGAEAYSKATDTTWALNTVQFTTGPSSSTATIYCYKNTGAGPGFCDDFSITKLTNPASLVLNGGFETGTRASWGLSSTVAVDVTAAAAHSGSFGLSTGAANSGVQQTISGLQPGTTYVLTGWLRAASGEQLALGVKSFGAAESYHAVTGSTYAPAAVVFTTGTASTQATVYCYKGAGSSTGSCDDLMLVAVG